MLGKNEGHDVGGYVVENGEGRIAGEALRAVRERGHEGLRERRRDRGDIEGVSIVRG